MDIEFLVSTLENENTIELYKKMNINANAIITNQHSNYFFSENYIESKRIKTFTSAERGIGLSRNNGLFHSNSEVCVLADDDMIYDKNAVETIKKAYEKYPDADLILFDVLILENGTTRKTVKKTGRVRLRNCLRYGAVSCTFRRESILKKNISFSLLFGGGAKYGSGEDSIFFWTALSKGLKVYSVNERIAVVNNDDSTWFQGYSEKFFYDKGALFYSLSKYYYHFFCIQFLIRHRKKFSNEKKLIDTYKIMMKGARDIKL